MPQTEGVPGEANPRIFFTAPWEPVVVRRGDALGLRALADQFADAIAPQLSNRIRDGRWVTILAWCLARSHDVFHASGGRSAPTRAQQRERYAWLRPLELLWVARTIAIAEDWKQRSLAGQRRVRPWYQDDGQRANRFGMSVDQFHAYRQTGMYGGYRLAFRTWPGMTVHGDGWTPGPETIRLAKWLDDKLGGARPGWPLHSPRSAKRMRGEEHRWWSREWPTFDQRGRNADKNTLPRPKSDFSVLPEGDLLKPLVFGSDLFGRLRTRVAREVAKASAVDHIAVCNHLGRVFADDGTVKLLPRFSRLADAGMAAMDLIADAMRGKTDVSLSDVAKRANAKATCKELFSAAQAWRQGPGMQLRHEETAHRFASTIPSARPIDCLGALLQHHEVDGGGLRWFVLRNGKVESRSPQGVGSSRYRFRLWSLCRLAAQCGVLQSMPLALRADVEGEEDETLTDDANE